MKEKLYAHRISKRAITILDVPEQYRETVMGLLSESDRGRQLRLMAEQA